MKFFRFVPVAAAALLVAAPAMAQETATVTYTVAEIAELTLNSDISLAIESSEDFSGVTNSQSTYEFITNKENQELHVGLTNGSLGAGLELTVASVVGETTGTPVDVVTGGALITDISNSSGSGNLLYTLSVTDSDALRATGVNGVDLTVTYTIQQSTDGNE